MGCVLSKEEEQQEEHEEEEESLSPCSLLQLVKTKKQERIQNIQTIFNNEYKKSSYKKKVLII